MKITIFGLAITSAWGNGHATTYRSLVRALRKRGHQIVFFERDVEWYVSNRDMPDPDFCHVYTYQNWNEIRAAVQRELADSDVAMVGSYCPDGLKAIDEMLSSSVRVKTFYDIDTPITVTKLRSGAAEYLNPAQIPGFDIYFSFTGGPILAELENQFGAQRAVPLYCSFDPGKHSACLPKNEFTCDLSYMGTFAPDRQGKLHQLFCEPAKQLPRMKFYLAGAQYPVSLVWPQNVQRTIHLYPRDHAALYCSSVLTLNLTRSEMVEAGFSPSVRMFEAAGCGAAIVSDIWPGLETFFVPGEEILLASSSAEVHYYLSEMDRSELKRIGRAARAKVSEEHSSDRRAAQFEAYLELGEYSAEPQRSIAIL